MNFFKRLFACGLDLLVVGTFLQIYFYFFGIAGSVEDGVGGGGYVIRSYDWVVIVLIWYLYFCLQEYYFKKTLGKRIFGLTIIKTDNGTLTFIDVLKRRSFDFIELLFLPLIAIILILTSQNAQRLGDMLANTKLIDRKIK